MNIDEILKDLYALDASLEKYEDKLRKIVGDLIAAKPDIVLDENFVRELKMKILDKAEIMKEKKGASFSDLFVPLKRLPYVFGVLALALVAILIVGIYFSNPGGFLPSQNSGSIALKSEVTQLQEGAFGSLADLSATTEEEASPVSLNETKQSNNNSSQSGVVAMSAPAAGMGGGGSGTVSPGIIIAQPATPYEYVYKGDSFSVPDAKMAVYKKIDNPVNLPFSQILSNFNFSGIGLGNFSSAKVDNLTISEDRQLGYMVNVDLKTGTLSIYKNWEKWPQNYPVQCKGNICMMTNANGQTGSSINLPSNDEIVKIADDFLKQYGVDMSAYGPGVVQDYNRMYPLGAATPESANSAMPYIQPEIPVVYPLIIDGKTVYDQSGNENGLNVGVDITQKKVSYMYNLTLQKYQSSPYETIQDTNKIIKAAESGNLYYYGTATDSKEIDLGTPFLGLDATWKYDNNTGTGYELYVPALIFPIQNPPANLYQKNVVVPIIKDVFDSTYNPVQPSPKPLPAQSNGNGK